MNRLEGLDLARFLAFVGMVIVNFHIVMADAAAGAGWTGFLVQALEGRAAATFVVLAGIGLGLAAGRGPYGQTFSTTLKRGVFLLVIGLLNTLIFSADILHYYAFYFLFGVLALRLSNRNLLWGILALNIVFITMLMLFDYETGWDWSAFEYTEFWTPVGFLRNLFYNGWHPVAPWLGFFLFGIVLARLQLNTRRIQWRLVGFGALGLALSLAVSAFLTARLGPDLVELATTSPVPPMPLYMTSGMSGASLVAGLCLLVADRLKALGILGLLTPAGRQTLSLYFGHIYIGMGTLEALGMLGGQSVEASVMAALIFSLLSLLYALIWARFFKRGPLEFLMRKLAG